VPTASGYNVLARVSNVIITGQAVTRVTFAAGATDAALLDRTKEADPDFLIPLRDVKVRLYFSIDDPLKSAPVAEAKTDDEGRFDLAGAPVYMGVSYKLVAVYANKTEKLESETVTIDKIKVTDLPPIGGTVPMNCEHKNQPAPQKTNVADETEKLTIDLFGDASGFVRMDFMGKAALAFNTLLLNVPHISQVYEGPSTGTAAANAMTKRETKSVNIDGHGAVTGGILCFPTCMAMALKYYGLFPNTTQNVATRIYRLWEMVTDAKKRPVHQKGTTKTDNYQFNFGIVDKNTGQASGWSNIWEWWVWQLRCAREALNLTLSDPWAHKKDNDALDAWPESGGPVEAAVHWDSVDLLQKSESAYVRRQLGRGWPIILGTNLTTAGHIIILRGVVVNQKGEVHKIIVNNPYDKSSTGIALYYDGKTVGQSGAALKILHNMAVRKGMTRDEVLEKVVRNNSNPA